ncbi:MAG TPA: sensor histidine kinase [Rhodopila sp.]|nr:sensor histidine kinase [Rhodopila sp.]
MDRRINRWLILACLLLPGSLFVAETISGRAAVLRRLEAPAAEVSLLLLACRASCQTRHLKDANARLLARTLELSIETRWRSKVKAELADALRDTVQKQEAERARLARELHDTLGQHAAVLQFGLDELMREPGCPDAVQDRARMLKTTAAELSHGISHLAWELRPAGLEELGLEVALRSLADTVSRRAGLRIDVQATGRRSIDSTVETTLYRIAQEALTNTVKHAAATRIGLVLDQDPSRVQLIIEDNGRGFTADAPATLRPGARLGLLGVRECLALVGGTLEIETRPGSGTTLYIRIPNSGLAA